jgi:hypothetical protein
LSESNRLNRRLSTRFIQPHVHEIQREHTQQIVDCGMNNLGWLSNLPHGWKSEEAAQFINAALKVFDFLCKIFGLRVHFSTSAYELLQASCWPLAKYSKGLAWQNKQRILLTDSAGDDRRRSPQNVDDIAAT